MSAPTHPTIDDTIELAARLHRGQRDKAGVPYIAHPLAVMRRVPERSWHVAVLHDTLEDCGVTAGRLEAFGYSEEEINALLIVTRGSYSRAFCDHGCRYDHAANARDESYCDFIERIATSGNVMAIEVKIADLLDNLDPNRPPTPIIPIAEVRKQRYRKALARLSEVVRLTKSGTWR